MRFQRARAAAALIAGLGAGLVACPELHEPIELDLEPPYLLGVTPGGNSVAVDAQFEVKFSEPVQRESIWWLDEEFEEYPDAVVLAPAEHEEYLSSAVKSPPLSSTQRSKTVPCEIELSPAGDTVLITPYEPLEGLREYVIVVSEELKDQKNNKLLAERQDKIYGNVVVRFTTAPAPDRTKPAASLQSPPAGSAGVAIDLRTVEVLFSEEMDSRTITRDTLGLVEANTQTMVLPDAVVLDGLVARLTLAPRVGQGCDRLCLESVYDLYVSPAVTDLAGNAVEQASLVGQSFAAAACNDTEAPRIASASLAASPADKSAVITWKTDEASDSVVQYVAGNAAAFAAACEPTASAACRVATGAPAACPPEQDVCALPSDEASYACTHSVRLSGLTPETSYTWRVVATDAGGRVRKGEAKVLTTIGEQPAIVVNEIFVSPNSPPGTAGEFVELYNAGSTDVDLAGWKLARCTDNDCGGLVEKHWTMKAATGGSTLLAPGKFAVAAGDSFDAALLGVPADAILLRGSSSTVVSGGLRDSNSDGYALLSPEGLIISTYGAHLGGGGTTGKKGKSFERKSALEPDASSNWAVSTAAIPNAAGNFATPGARNSVSP